MRIFFRWVRVLLYSFADISTSSDHRSRGEFCSCRHPTARRTFQADKPGKSPSSSCLVKVIPKHSFFFFYIEKDIFVFTFGLAYHSLIGGPTDTLLHTPALAFLGAEPTSRCEDDFLCSVMNRAIFHCNYSISERQTGGSKRRGFCVRDKLISSPLLDRGPSSKGTMSSRSRNIR